MTSHQYKLTHLSDKKACRLEDGLPLCRKTHSSFCRKCPSNQDTIERRHLRSLRSINNHLSQLALRHKMVIHGFSDVSGIPSRIQERTFILEGMHITQWISSHNADKFFIKKDDLMFSKEAMPPTVLIIYYIYDRWMNYSTASLVLIRGNCTFICRGFMPLVKKIYK